MCMSASLRCTFHHSLSTLSAARFAHLFPCHAVGRTVETYPLPWSNCSCAIVLCTNKYSKSILQKYLNWQFSTIYCIARASRRHAVHFWTYIDPTVN